MKKFLFLLFFSLISTTIHAQAKISLRDSLDHKLDLSDWVIKANGFIPIPYLITEPALGNIGGALFAVFVDPNTPYQDSIGGKLVKTHVRPNLYGGGGAYTANQTWLTGGFASGVFKKWRVNYRIYGGYVDLNLNFYRELPSIGERSFEFNMRTIPLTGYLTKQIGRSNWAAGLDYMFLKNELRRTNSQFNTPKEVNSLISRLSILAEYDSRDNIFSPDKGMQWNTLYSVSSDFIGSDYNYTSVNSAVFYFLPISKKLFSGFRAEYQQIFGDMPFYMKPYISMRGIPVMRYQGDIIALAETEWRYDFTTRYSLVAFAGTSQALLNGSSFETTSWKTAGGLGGRYLIARKLKLRMGLDVARGPEDWAYYVVFGSNWGR